MRWLTFVLLAGCNQLFGLAPTKQPLDAPADISPNVDEDQDGIANDVDDCPGIYDPGQLDSDGDGVGDACDPHRDTPGDRIVATAFFSQAIDPPWVPDSATSWQVHDGAVYTAPPSDGTFVRLTGAFDDARPTIELGFTVVDYGTAPDGNPFQVSLDFGNDPGTCLVASVGQTTPINYVVIDQGQGNPIRSTGNLQPGSFARLTYRREPTATPESCVLIGTEATVTTLSPLTQPGLTATIATGEQVAIAYIVLYSSP